MSFRSIDEFRHALAHMNPKLTLPDGSVFEGTAEELRQFRGETALGAFAPKRRGAPKGRKRGRKKKRKVRTTEEMIALTEMKPEGTKATPPQLGFIAAAAGGMKGLSPKMYKAFKAGRKDITNTKILQALGLTEWNDAAHLMAALRLSGLLQRNTVNSEEAKKSREIIGLYIRDMNQRAKSNPSYSIPSMYPASDYEFAPRPRVAHWTSYPQYSYDQFYRPNTPRMRDPGAASRMPSEAGTGTSIAICNGCSCPSCGAHPGQQCVTAKGNPTRPHAARRRAARRNPAPVPIPPSSAGAEPVPWEMADNAGPFVPEMYPYGMRGKPQTYSGLALQNGISEFDRHAAARAGGTLDRSGSWPVKVPHWSAAKNRQQALIALQFMVRGFGDRAKYGTYLKKLAALYPPEVGANREIWTFFRQHRDDIKRMGGRIPTMRTLRKVNPKRISRAAANPSRSHLRPQLRRMEWVHEDE